MAEKPFQLPWPPTVPLINVNIRSGSVRLPAEAWHMLDALKDIVGDENVPGTISVQTLLARCTLAGMAILLKKLPAAGRKAVEAAVYQAGKAEAEPKRVHRKPKALERKERPKNIVTMPVNG